MKAVYVAKLTPLPDKSGYAAHVPDVSGCVTTGRDLRDTLYNIKDALEGCLCVLEDEGEVIPEPAPLESIDNTDGAVLALVDVDTFLYRTQTDTRSIRKNVSMPVWMYNLVEQRGINCSQLLQDAIRHRLNL